MTEQMNGTEFILVNVFIFSFLFEDVFNYI